VAKSNPSADRTIDELRASASRVLAASVVAADELEQIVEQSLPRNASQGLRTHLRQVIVRLRDTSSVLARELDSSVADPEIVGWLVRILKRTASVALAGTVLVTGTVATGMLEKSGADLLPEARKRLMEIVYTASQMDDLGPTDPASGSFDGPDRSTSTALHNQFAERFTANGIGMFEKYLRANSSKEVVERLWFVLELEPLLQDDISRLIRERLGDNWRASLTSILGTAGDRPLRALVESADLSSFTINLSDIVRLVPVLEERGILPAGYLSLDGTDRDECLRRIVRLRNELAHGRGADEEWASAHWSGGSEAVVVVQAMLIYDLLASNYNG
jgi:hypothetical protein